MLRFFCTRCGTQLQVAATLAGGEVRCPHCRGIVRTPDAGEDIPLAERASPMEDLVDQLEPLPADELEPYPLLSRAVPIAGTPLVLSRSEELAERLKQVDDDAEPTMTECPHCGSTIASYVGQCPFCRHPLRRV